MTEVRSRIRFSFLLNDISADCCADYGFVYCHISTGWPPLSTIDESHRLHSTNESLFQFPRFQTFVAKMKLSLIFALYLLHHHLFPFTLASEAYPSAYGDAAGEALVVRREEYDGGRILDITHRYTEDMPRWDSSDGLGQFLWLLQSMKNGSLFYSSEFKLPAHCGTHVDSPGHVFQHYFEAGFDVDTLDLEVLNGVALLVDVPRDKNITAEVMKSLNIPKGVRRVLFRTLNTDRKLMKKREFDTSYVGFTEDGAQWLVENTDIKLVGVDYLSVAAYDDLIPSHLVFLKNREIILVEALKLDNIKPGIYSLHCLPLRLLGAEGSPTRCILIK